MTEERRFMQFWAQFEVEVIDPIQAKTFTMATSEADGAVGLRTPVGDDEAIALAVQFLTFQALAERGESAGIQWLGGSVQPRERVGNGYPTTKIGWMPARRGDGSLPPEDEMPPLGEEP